MQALNIISQEHANLWRVTVAFDHLAEGIGRGDPVDSAFFNAAFDYLEHFVDRAHHPKEDEHLFPRLRARDAEAAALIERLQSDHRAGPLQLLQPPRICTSDLSHQMPTDCSQLTSCERLLLSSIRRRQGAAVLLLLRLLLLLLRFSTYTI